MLLANIPQECGYLLLHNVSHLSPSVYPALLCMYHATFLMFVARLSCPLVFCYPVFYSWLPCLLINQLLHCRNCLSVPLSMFWKLCLRLGLNSPHSSTWIPCSNVYRSLSSACVLTALLPTSNTLIEDFRLLNVSEITCQFLHTSVWESWCGVPIFYLSDINEVFHSV